MSYKYLFLIIIIFICFSCQPIKNIIYLENNLNEIIFFDFNIKDKIIIESYPNRIKNKTPNYICEPIYKYKLLPNSKFKLFIFENHTVDINMLKKYIEILNIYDENKILIKSINDFNNTNLHEKIHVNLFDNKYTNLKVF
jgi:hypothetical protein